MGKRSNQSRLDIKITRDALRSCVAVALESLPKPRDILSEMWVMPRVKIILVSHGRLIPPPAGWTLSHRTIPHGKVGGVTGIIGHVGICVRHNHANVTSALGAVKGGFHPRRDLRAVLKMAVGGIRCGAPKENPKSSNPIGEIVKEVPKGVILNTGLLKVATKGTTLRLPRVKTLFGGTCG